MTAITCFKCGKYTVIKDTRNQENNLTCKHQKYFYKREKPWIHNDLQKIPSKQKVEH